MRALSSLRLLVSAVIIGILPCRTWGAAASLNMTRASTNATSGADPMGGSSVGFATAPTGKMYVAYFIAWGIYGRNFQPENIPASKITHLNYAFANIDASGKIVLGDSYADIDKAYPGDSWEATTQPYRGTFWQINNKIKQANPQLKTMISVGGWTWSTRFSDAALTDASRETFAKSCAEFITQYGFDGVDLDWEYPVEGGLESNVYRPEDGKNYNLLLAAVRKELDALGEPRRLLSIASPAGPKLVGHLILDEMAQYVDFVNVMTYDFRGGWSNYTGHHTPLYPSSTDPDTSLTDTSTVIKNIISKGMPPEKINVGVGFYGRGWAGTDSANNGLFQKYASVPKGSWDDGTSGNTGVFDYKDVKQRVASGAMTRFFDDEVKAPWAFSPTDGLMISYDDPESISEKVKFVNEMNLGGIMTWELTGDDNEELTDVIVNGLAGTGGAVVSPPAPAPSSVVSSAVPVATVASSSSFGNMASTSTAPPPMPSTSSSSGIVPTLASVSSVSAPLASSASSVSAPLASSASSVVAPFASSASSVVVPIATSMSSAVSSVSNSATAAVLQPPVTDIAVQSVVSSVVAPSIASDPVVPATMASDATVPCPTSKPAYGGIVAAGVA